MGRTSCIPSQVLKAIMPAVFSCPQSLSAAAPVANTSSDNAKPEEKIQSHDVAISLTGSVPEMYRRTMTAMIDGHKISPLIPLQFIECCSKQAIDASAEISTAEESEESLEEEFVKKTGVEAENTQQEAWVFKPSVGTWLLPLHAHAEAEAEESALNAHETSIPSFGTKG